MVDTNKQCLPYFFMLNYNNTLIDAIARDKYEKNDLPGRGFMGLLLSHIPHLKAMFTVDKFADYDLAVMTNHLVSIYEIKDRTMMSDYAKSEADKDGYILEVLKANKLISKQSQSGKRPYYVTFILEDNQIKALIWNLEKLDFTNLTKTTKELPPNSSENPSNEKVEKKVWLLPRELSTEQLIEDKGEYSTGLHYYNNQWKELELIYV